MSEKSQENKEIGEKLDPRALRAALQDRQAQPRPGLAFLMSRAAEQIRPAGMEVENKDA